MTHLYTQSYAICPWCEQKSGKGVDHLFEGRDRNAGPWSCDACGNWFSVKVSADNEVVLKKIEQHDDGRVHKQLGRWLALLKLETKGKPMYFVVDAYGEAGADPEERNAHHSYFYEENDCPTNWLRHVLMVAVDGDLDPHGPWDHVRSIEVSRDFDTDDDDAVAALFTELAG